MQAQATETIRLHAVRVSEFSQRVGKWETQFPESARRLLAVTVYHDAVAVTRRAVPEAPVAVSGANLFQPTSADFTRLGGAELELLPTDPTNDLAPLAAGEGSGSLSEALSSWLGHRVGIPLGPGAYWLTFRATSEVYGGGTMLVLIARDPQYALQTAVAQRFVVLRDVWQGFELLFEVAEPGTHHVFFLAAQPFRMDDTRLIEIEALPRARNRLPLGIGDSVGKLVLTLNRGREFSTYPIIERRYNTVFGEHSPAQRIPIDAPLDYKLAEGYVEQSPKRRIQDVILHFELACVAEGGAA